MRKSRLCWQPGLLFSISILANWWKWSAKFRGGVGQWNELISRMLWAVGLDIAGASFKSQVRPDQSTLRLNLCPRPGDRFDRSYQKIPNEDAEGAKRGGNRERPEELACAIQYETRCS